MARTARTHPQVDHRAAALQRGADCAPEVDAATPRMPQPPSEPDPEAAHQQHQQLVSNLVLELGVAFEGGALNNGLSRLAMRFEPPRFASLFALGRLGSRFGLPTR